MPDGYFVEANQTFRSLKSTPDAEGHPRCNALTGEIRKSVACEIYHQRPTPCRDFKHSFEDGGPAQPRCDEARIKFGMLPLVDPAIAPVLPPLVA